MKNPRYMNSKFDSTCCDCGRHINKGERIRYLGRSQAQCSDCMPAESITQQNRTASQQAHVAKGGTFDDWASALAWDSDKPAPGASIGVKPQRGNPVVELVQPDGRDNCEQCGKLDELSHNDALDMALCHDCDTAADAQPEPIVSMADPVKFTQAERAEGMTCELLVVLVNAIDVAGVGGRHAVAQFCNSQARQSVDRRAMVWRGIASAVQTAG